MRKTDELMRMLAAEPDIGSYLADCAGDLTDDSLCGRPEKLLQKYGAAKKDVIRRAGLNQIYGYQIFAGTKSPSRDKLLAIIFGFPLSLEDAQRLLKVAGVSELYPRKRRDSILIFGLVKGLSLPELDDLLYEMGEATLSREV